MPSSRKSWALRCATGLDVRSLGLSDAAMGALLDRVDSDPQAVIAELQEAGATGTPKLPAAARDAAHRSLFKAAWEAGRAAGEACVPTPMIVSGGYTPEADGACGFAWVTILPGTSSFARWLVKSGHGRKGYEPGITVRIGDYRQSEARKSAHAQAMAAALRGAGLKAYAGSRLD